MGDNIKILINKLNKDYGENTIGFASDLKYSEIPRLPSGSLFLDYTLGQNHKDLHSGWPLGRIVELYGPESSGKSLICLKTIVEAQKAGYVAAYIDCENSFDKQFAEQLGVDTSKLLITRESQAEKVLEIIGKLLEEYKDVKVIIVDSLASMIPKVEIEADLEANQMASVARVMSKGLRKLIHKNKNNALVIFINQLRENPGAGMYANPEYTPGGKALKYYSSIRAEVRKGEWLFEGEDKKKKIGQTVKFKIVKNKTDIPLREGYFKFLYKGEIDKMDELVSLALLNDKISRKGPYYAFGNHTWQGRDKMEKELADNKETFEELRKEVFS